MLRLGVESIVAIAMMLESERQRVDLLPAGRRTHRANWPLEPATCC